MTSAADTAIVAFAFLAVKHAIADFYLQTRYQWANKGTYGHPGGLLHAGIHLACSAPLLLIVPPASTAYGAAVLAGEFVIHYHCDWSKEQLVKRNGWTPTTNAFWRALGTDQLVHALTYVAMVAALMR